MIDPWNKDSIASKRALDNARDVERTALNLLVDIQSGAFAGADTMEPMVRAMETLAQAYELAQRRWDTFLNRSKEAA